MDKKYSKEDIFNKLCTILEEEFEIEKSLLSKDANLFTDLDLDSVDAVDLAVRLQQFTDKRISPEEFKQIKTLEDVVESLYTSQTRYTQLSFANNVIAVQEVIKRIRTRCPAIRYSFIDGDDLAEYKARVEEIIAPYRPNFRTLALEYMQDAYYTENKIFYATLVVQFRDFVQTEYFKIVAIGSSVVYTSPSASSTGGTVTVP